MIYSDYEFKNEKYKNTIKVICLKIYQLYTFIFKQISLILNFYKDVAY